MNVTEHIRNHFTHIQLNKDNIFLYAVRNSILEAVKQNKILLKGKLLDIGCGIMPYRDLIISENQVTKYIGMDLENAAYHGNIPPDLIWNGAKIPLEDKTVDCEIATEFLEHYHDTQNILKEMARVLKPNGVLFGTVPFIWNLHEVPYDEYRFTPYSLTKHLEKAGFENIQIQALGGANAALAQMLGLWFNVKSFRGKKFCKYPVYWFYKWLLKNDVKPEKFDGASNSLYNGLSFVAYKSAAYISSQ